MDQLLDLEPEARERILAKLSDHEKQALFLVLRHDWRRWARPEQVPPDELGLWDVWIMLAGRGGGKTRPAAQTVNEWAAHPEEYTNGEMPRFLLVAKDAKQCRDVMVEGESGIIACAAPWGPQPKYEPSKSRVTWYLRGKEWALAEMHSAEEPKTLRGPQGHKGWGDEFAAWKAKPGAPPAAWSEGLDMAVRLGRRPQIILTSTPTATEFVADLCFGPKTGTRRLVTPEILAAAALPGYRRWHFDVGNEDGSSERTVVCQWPTERNRDNLAAGKVAKWRARYGGTRLGRQELDGEILEKVEGALWIPERFDLYRREGFPPLARVAVAVDPTRADEPDDECGIMVGGRGKDGRGYLLADCTVKGSPDLWARAAVSAYHKFGAQDLVYEDNRLGHKMRETIETVDRSVHWIAVKAIEDKKARASPVSALSEQGKISHVGPPDEFDVLEAELCGWDPNGRRSPNRLDAYVWLFTALLIGLRPQAPIVVPMSLMKDRRQ